MTNLPVPCPEPPEENRDKTSSEGAQSGEDSAGTRPNGPGIPTEKACLQALAQLAGMAVLKYMTPAQVNATSRIYTTLLGHHQKRHGSDQGSVIPDEAIDVLLRANPQLLDDFAPLLTDTQVAGIMKQSKGGESG